MNKILKTRRYTIVEILVVIGLMAILMGIGTAGFNAITTKSGVRGGVSMISSQINLARSVAVAQNRYVALLLPAPDATKNPEDNLNSNSKFKDKFFTSMRLCYVERKDDGEYEFMAWVEERYWVELPSKVCANFVQGKDKADIIVPPDTEQKKYEVKTIEKVPSSSTPGDCYGIIFKPRGSLVSDEKALVQVFPGVSNADGSLEMLGLGNSDWLNQNKGNLKYRRWCVEINRFTGRSKISYAQVEE
ncbi:MAG: hypothetical protein PHT71_02905 [Victivallaceae bacterium]|nr:hypothetical protein [Victivallaceae bacterium]